MCGEKTGDVIFDRVPDPVVCASFAATGLYNVPEGNMVCGKPGDPGRIQKIPIDQKEHVHDLPEMVPGVAVIFASQERLTAWKTAKDKDFRGCAGDGSKTGGTFRGRGC